MEEIIAAGYTGEATQEDWLRLMAENGGSEVFGNEAEQMRIAESEKGNIDLFIEWFKIYVK